MSANIVELLTHLISSYGLFAVFFLMVFEAALIPIPSEVTIPFAGFLVAQGFWTIWQVVLLGSLGNLTGALIAYSLGYVKGEKWLLSFIDSGAGKLLLLTKAEYYKAKSWFNRFGKTIVFMSQLLPVARTFISLPAGTAKTNLVSFTVLSFLGSVVWSMLLVYLGLRLGQNWPVIEPYFRKFQFSVIAFGVLALALYLKHKFRKRR